MKRKAFSLLEMMMVVAIISILLSLLAAAVHGARRRQYTAQAMAETNQIIQAIKTYWIAYGTLPNGIGQYVTRDVAEQLKLETSEYSFEAGGTAEDALLDPWGRKYEIRFPTPEDPDVKKEIYQTNIHFMNTEMFYYHEY